MTTRWRRINAAWAIGVGALGALLGSAAAPAHAAPPRTVYEKRMITAVQNHVDVYRAWDLEAFVDTFAEDAQIMVDGRSAKGRAQIREFYRSNFEDVPHTIQIIESGVNKGMVYLTVAYRFEDGYERCCSYGEYYVKNGKIAFLNVTMTNRRYRLRDPEAEAETPKNP